MSPWLITTMAWPALAATLARTTLRVATDPVTVSVCAGLLALGGAVTLAQHRGRRSTS